MDSELGAMEAELLDNNRSDEDYVLNDSDQRKWLMEKILLVGVKLFRLLYRFRPSEKSLDVRNFSCALISAADATKELALRLDEDGKEDLNFSLNIPVLGKSGVEKSFTINSISGEEKAEFNVFDVLHLASKRL